MNPYDMTEAQLIAEEARMVDKADSLMGKFKPNGDNRQVQYELECAEERLALVRYLLTKEMQP